MRRPGWTPSIVPNGDDQNVYIVVDDFGRNGRAYRETDLETADLETVILGLLEGEYNNPVRVVAFNTAEGLVAGCLNGHRPRAAPPMRPANARRAIQHSRVRRATLRARPAAKSAAGVRDSHDLDAGRPFAPVARLSGYRCCARFPGFRDLPYPRSWQCSYRSRRINNTSAVAI
jgi:hypothetical protein